MHLADREELPDFQQPNLNAGWLNNCDKLLVACSIELVESVLLSVVVQVVEKAKFLTDFHIDIPQAVEVTPQDERFNAFFVPIPKIFGSTTFAKSELNRTW